MKKHNRKKQRERKIMILMSEIAILIGLIFVLLNKNSTKINKVVIESIPKESNNIENTIDETQTEASETQTEASETQTEASETEEQFADVNQYIYTSNSINMYDNIDGNIIDNINIYNKAYEIASNGKWDIIKYDDMTGYITNQDIDYLGENFVEVDITNQTVNLYKDNELVLTDSVVTGKDTTPTITGIYDIKAKATDVTLKGPNYQSFVNFWMPFKGGYGLHNAPWRSEFGGEIYHDKGSHGCVNMSYDTAKGIYNNVTVGTKVLVYKRTN